MVEEYELWVVKKNVALSDFSHTIRISFIGQVWRFLVAYTETDVQLRTIAKLNQGKQKYSAIMSIHSSFSTTVLFI